MSTDNFFKLNAAIKDALINIKSLKEEAVKLSKYEEAVCLYNDERLLWDILEQINNSQLPKATYRSTKAGQLFCKIYLNTVIHFIGIISPKIFKQIKSFIKRVVLFF
jgi:hypothetical protein